MFNLFPFNIGNGFTFSSYTSITSSNGVNIFGGINGFFGGNGFENIDFNNSGINNRINSGYYNNDFYNNLNANNSYEQLNNIDINELANEFRALLNDMGKQINIQEIASEYMNAISNMDNEKNKIEEEECPFIKFKELNDMYVLKIDLTGIDLRELSVKYDPGTIKISLKRSEFDGGVEFNGYSNPKVIKRQYKKTFDNIDDVDLSRVIKNVDGGCFNLSMPKKYALEQGNNIIDVDKFIVEESNPRVEDKIRK